MLVSNSGSYQDTVTDNVTNRPREKESADLENVAVNCKMVKSTKLESFHSTVTESLLCLIESSVC